MNIYKYISKVALLLILISTAYACDDINKDLPPLVFEEEFEIDVKDGMNLVGVITDDDKKPIEGVVVSDGYTVITTDQDGVYQIKKNKLAKFVFISTPENYEVPTESNTPLFYRAIRDNKNPVIREDFSLKKKQKESDFVLLALADVQLRTENHVSLFESKTVPDIIKLQESYPAGTKFYGIALGDIVWDNFKLYPEYKRNISKISATFLQVIGNHDHDKNITNDDYNASSGYEANLGPTYYSYNVGDCHFVVLDDVYYKGLSDYDYIITDEQIEWLKKDLQHVDKNKLIIVGTHVPTQRRGSSTAVQNNYMLYEALKGYKVRILSGHLHVNIPTTINENIEENNLGAVMGAGWVDDLCTDGSPSGYGVYEIKGNKIEKWYYKGTEQPANKQMWVYPLNSWPKDAGGTNADVWNKSIILNIWRWHTDWTVEVFEDGVSKGNISNYTSKDYDPKAFNSFFGDQKPTNSPGIEPMKHDHMFYYTPSVSTWKTITIKATDSNGEVFTEEISNS